MNDKIIGLSTNKQPLEKVIDQSVTSIEQERQIVVSCANPHSLASTKKNATFYSALSDAEILLTDGIGLKLLAKLLGKNAGPRITGNDYFESILQRLNADSHSNATARVFFFGSSERVLNRIANRFKTDYPRLNLCGVYSPPFGEWGDEKNQAMIDVINASNPDLLFVGMTAPKQECWAYANRSKLNAKVIANIGAVFDFYAETHPRAPAWTNRLGMEWLYRLVREPKRMWRRTFISVPLFLWYTLRDARPKV